MFLAAYQFESLYHYVNAATCSTIVLMSKTYFLHCCTFLFHINPIIIAKRLYKFNEIKLSKLGLKPRSTVLASKID